MRKLKDIDKVGQELALYKFPTEEVTYEQAQGIATDGGLISYTDAKGKAITVMAAAALTTANKAKEMPRFVWHKAVTRAAGAKTKKGYDTTGYGYQFIVNALNEVLGMDGWRTEAAHDETPGEYESGRPNWHVLVRMRMILRFASQATEVIKDAAKKEVDTRVVEISHEGHGGHRSSERESAYKGATTNAIKKVAAMFGLGRTAYEGTLDEDYQALEGKLAPPKVKAADKPPKNKVTTGAKKDKGAKPATQPRTTRKPKDRWPGFVKEIENLFKNVDISDADRDSGVNALLEVQFGIPIPQQEQPSADRDAALNGAWQLLSQAEPDKRAFILQSAQEMWAAAQKEGGGE